MPRGGAHNGFKATRFWAHTERQDRCLVWVGKRDRKGYGRAHQNGRERFAHRIAYELVHGPIPAGLGVLHHCDNPPCIDPEHLYAGTQTENMRDAIERGRFTAYRGSPGARNGSAKLDEAAVLALYIFAAARVYTEQALAKSFGVSRLTVQNIKHKRSLEVCACYRLIQVDTLDSPLRATAR